MTEEAKKIVEALRMCHDPKYGCYDCPVDVPGEPCQNELKAADLIESLSAENEILNAEIGQLGAIECHRDMLEHELEQVTRERDALQVEIDVLNEEYYAGIHTIRPAVDAEPVRHGYWIPQDNTHTKFMCSDCKGRNHDGSGKYCSECGCKMDGEVEG